MFLAIIIYEFLQGEEMEHFVGAYKKYADFTGRARRKEYWMFYLFYVLAFIALTIVDAVLGMYNADAGIGLLGGLFALASFVPSIAIAARRLHDTNRSGWWQLILLIPFIGPIVLLVFLVLRGDIGDNRFGNDPIGALA
jgi:uncharacterized membrane protein YhaH (DUF805 family)